MKATGADIKQFWDEWPPGEHWYNDDAPLNVYEHGDDSKPCALELDQKYELGDFGVLAWQGPEGMEIPRDAPIRGEDYVSFERWFKHWKKGRTSTTLTVEVKNEDVVRFKEILEQNGWKAR